MFLFFFSSYILLLMWLSMLFFVFIKSKSYLVCVSFNLISIQNEAEKKGRTTNMLRLLRILYFASFGFNCSPVCFALYPLIFLLSARFGRHSDAYKYIFVYHRLTRRQY